MKTGLSAAERLRLLFTLRVELVTSSVCHPWLVAWSFQLPGLQEYVDNTPSSFPLEKLQFVHNLVGSSPTLVQQFQGFFTLMVNIG